MSACKRCGSALHRSDECEEQPSYEDLIRAWNAAIECRGIGGASSATLQELIELRERKTTWFGKEENDLRFMLDAYLRDNGYPFTPAT